MDKDEQFKNRIILFYQYFAMMCDIRLRMQASRQRKINKGQLPEGGEASSKRPLPNMIA